MPVSQARKIAYQVLGRVESGRGFAADLLCAPAVSALSEADRSLVTELVMGTLRRRAELDTWIERLSAKPLSYFDPEVITILRLGIYQIRLLDRVPKPAAVNEAVEMTRAARKSSAAGLVNAVLRKCERGKRGAGKVREEEALRLALPDWLAERWAERWGNEAVQALARRSLQTPPTVVRVAGGADRGELRQELAAEGILSSPTRYAPEALVVERGNVTRSKAWRERRCVIQEEASQLVGALVKPEPGHRVLDLCAAPGMKTLQMAAALRQGLLISCDSSGRRLRSMAGVAVGLLPSGVHWYRVQLDASLPIPFAMRFDRILLDAPCSGTGTIARNPEIKWRLRPEDIARLSEAQVRMFTGALDALAPGGRLVYATCSLEPEENEEVAERVLATKTGFRRLGRSERVEERAAPDPLFDEAGYFRTRPDLHGMDGFFAAVILREACLGSAV
jgi:16S rRNA (cytosine967-C5)-methyltransferase